MTDWNISLFRSTDRRLCSLRGAIVTFVLILVVILTTGIILGIVFGVINAQKNTSTTSAQNNQGNASTTCSALISGRSSLRWSLFLVTATAVTSALSSVSIGSQTGAPCSAYTTINDPTRSVTQVGSSGLCDDGPLFNTSNGGAWIRFVGTGGTIIPLSSVGMNHCGAFLSSWFNGTLPTAANVIQNGTVCFETSVNQCGWQFDMSVVFCFGSYYVYFLPPVTMCSARYCTAWLDFFE